MSAPDASIAAADATPVAAVSSQVANDLPSTPASEAATATPSVPPSATPPAPPTQATPQTNATDATPGDVLMVPPPAKKPRKTAEQKEKPKPVQLSKEELQHASVRVYLEQTVAPLLMDAMQHVARQRPSNPIRAIVQFLNERDPEHRRPAAPPGSKAAQAVAAMRAQEAGPSSSRDGGGDAGPSAAAQGVAQEAAKPANGTKIVIKRSSLLAASGANGKEGGGEGGGGDEAMEVEDVGAGGA